MKVEISEKSFEFLKRLIKEIDEQDNRCTADPYYYVIQEEKTLVCAPGCGDEMYYIHDGEGRTKEELMENFDLISDGEFDDFICSNGVEEIEIEKKHDDATLSNVFFTEKACHKHIELNHYHFNKPRSYVKHAWRNPEVESIFKAIREIVKNNETVG